MIFFTRPSAPPPSPPRRSRSPPINTRQTVESPVSEHELLDYIVIPQINHDVHIEEVVTEDLTPVLVELDPEPLITEQEPDDDAQAASRRTSGELINDSAQNTSNEQSNSFFCEEISPEDDMEITSANQEIPGNTERVLIEGVEATAQETDTTQDDSLKEPPSVIN